MKVRVLSKGPRGVVTAPPSKSFGHRAVVCAALAADSGESVIENLGRSQDIEATLRAVEALGCRACRRDDNTVVGRGERWSDVIDCGESGSTLRFFLPLAAMQCREITLSGRGRLMKRPLEAYERTFADSGVNFTKDGDSVKVRGPMRGGVRELPGDVSSQFVSGLLFASPLLEEDSEIRLTSPLESAAYAEMTVSVMRHFGVRVEGDEKGYRVGGRQSYKPARCRVEGDYSQAAFFLAAAALGRDVVCRGLEAHSRQGDRAMLDILREMNAHVEAGDSGVTVRAGTLRAVTVDARQIPDLVPPIAVLCCFCDGESRIVGAARLRLKESDRLRALAMELGRLGADIRETDDGLVINGKQMIDGGAADAHGDHRIAMASALASLRCRKPVFLSGAESVKKSYPNFWEDFEKESLLYG